MKVTIEKWIEVGATCDSDAWLEPGSSPWLIHLVLKLHLRPKRTEVAVVAKFAGTDLDGATNLLGKLKKDRLVTLLAKIPKANTLELDRLLVDGIALELGLPS